MIFHETVKLELTGQELEDIRHAVIASWSRGVDDEQLSDRLNMLMDKLARAAVVGHA